jgi:hypothetical protein
MNTIHKADQGSVDVQQTRRPPNNVLVTGHDNSVINFCIYCCITSWFNGYALVRTYSNSLETVLVSLSVALVSPVSVSTIFQDMISSLAHQL